MGGKCLEALANRILPDIGSWKSKGLYMAKIENGAVKRQGKERSCSQKESGYIEVG